MPSRATAKEFFDTVKACFTLFKKLGIKAEELEGLLAQAACHALPTLDQAAFDQLITVAILSKGKEKPSLTFVGQVTLNTSQTRPEAAQLTSPFVYQISLSIPPAKVTLPWPANNLGEQCAPSP
ncbi:hypothetical protein O181_045517 [Austropuccinia psidii MF-1]|uniref:Uncharacterized protein n=1 Tax=Austropuccinia psidii MF-1 TaxID=1389203 RepID=A0A9Q3DU13_9BASI|nr:hypothetical protein [Austropuccinia psidii MF-1]